MTALERTPLPAAAPRGPWPPVEGVAYVAGAEVPRGLLAPLEAAFGRPPRLLVPGRDGALPSDAVVFALDDLPGRRFLAAGRDATVGPPTVAVAAVPRPAWADRVVFLRPGEADPAAVAVAARAARIVASLERDRARLRKEASWQRAVLDDLRRVDPVTELCTREAFLDEVQRAIDLAHHTSTADGPAVVRFQLRGALRLRDRLGSQAFDELVVQLGHRVEGAVRDQDVPARLADGELAVLVRGVDTAPATARIVRAMAGFGREPVVLGPARTVAVAGGLGWAVFEEVGSPQTAEALLRAALPRWPVRAAAA